LFKRQKILLGLILNAKPNLKRTGLMKLAFLLKQETALSSDSSFYDFVPYNYGPYSFTLDRDLNALTRYGYLDHQALKINPALINEANLLFKSLDYETQTGIKNIIERYNLPLKILLRYVYERYPWFASRSKTTSAPKVKTRKTKAVYTVGYEGETIESFFCKILKASIERIIDIRHNPSSRKFGFSKKRFGELCDELVKLCDKFEIEYIHLPELGIPSTYRKTLETFEDYQKLLRIYERAILPQAAAARREAGQLMKERPSALLCFEADIQCCHRDRLAKAISADTGLPIIHL